MDPGVRTRNEEIPISLVPAMDAVHLWGDTGAASSHVVAPQIFRPRAEAGPEMLDDLYAQMTDAGRLIRASGGAPYTASAQPASSPEWSRRTSP